MSPYFELRVWGDPIPQGSKSVSKKGRMFEANKRTGPWREQVQAAAERHIGMLDNWTMPEGAVSVRLAFFITRPVSHVRADGSLKPSSPRWPHSKPDVDKLTRAVFDAMTAARVWFDDSRVVDLHVTKGYVDDEANAGFKIEVVETPT